MIMRIDLKGVFCIITEYDKFMFYYMIIKGEKVYFCSDCKGHETRISEKKYKRSRGFLYEN